MLGLSGPEVPPPKNNKPYFNPVSPPLQTDVPPPMPQDGFSKGGFFNGFMGKFGNSDIFNNLVKHQ